MKVSELEGVLLDYWAAKAAGHENVRIVQLHWDDKPTHKLVYIEWDEDEHTPFAPSKFWDEGGPIIEREKIELFTGPDDWGATSDTSEDDARGPTPLIAAMRFYVITKFGLEVPDEGE